MKKTFARMVELVLNMLLITAVNVLQDLVDIFAMNLMVTFFGVTFICARACLVVLSN